jgi:polyisoprenoid-binding protein YceI
MASGGCGARRFLWAGLVCLGALLVPRAIPAQSVPLRIDGNNSEARFIVRMRWRMRAEGRIASVSGEMSGDSAQGWRVLVVADGKSLVVRGPRWMDRVTRSEAFLAVDSHPEIRFHSERFSEQVLHSGGSVSGELTLRGLTRPVSFRLLPSGCDHPGRDCDLQVNGTINRKEFGMTAYPVSVRDDVELRMRVRLLVADGGSQ